MALLKNPNENFVPFYSLRPVRCPAEHDRKRNLSRWVTSLPGIIPFFSLGTYLCLFFFSRRWGCDKGGAGCPQRSNRAERDGPGDRIQYPGCLPLAGVCQDRAFAAGHQGQGTNPEPSDFYKSETGIDHWWT